MDNKSLVELAHTAMNRAYSPYSTFKVGAALLSSSGKVYLGCNIENASYGATICAERVALVKAVSEGELDFEAIAIVGSSGEFIYPCGLCRQFMSEFGLNLRIVVAQTDGALREHKLRELLPSAFVTFSGESSTQGA